MSIQAKPSLLINVRISLILAVLGFMLCSVVAVRSQTVNTGTVIGTVTDINGAVIANADVELRQAETGVTLQTKTGDDGSYVFSSVKPGKATIAFSSPGFKRALLNIEVSVSKSAPGNVQLQVGQPMETVEITESGNQLQTLNASIGEVITNRELVELPTTQRKVSELAYLQPATAPLTGTAGSSIQGIIGGLGGSVAGGRMDQNTAFLDGVIVNNQAGGFGLPGNIASFPIPVDAVYEFRGTISNPDSSRSSGGHFSFATRRGNNDWHGLGYWYHQNDNVNANTWTNNLTGARKSELKDNRAGGRLTGPIFKNKTFFTAFYEGRRFPVFVTGQRTGISESFRQGILRFRDNTGVIRSYNLNPANGPLSTACAGGSCDPRGIGINPLVQQHLAFYPVAPEQAGGDGLNTLRLRGPVSNAQINDTTMLRLDHNLSSKWQLSATHFWQRNRHDDNRQMDFNPNVTGGSVLKAINQLILTPHVLSAGATNQVSPNLTWDIRFGWVKQPFIADRRLPEVLVPGAGFPILLTGFTNQGGVLDNPGDPQANRARPQENFQTAKSINSTATWVRGAHLFTGSFHYQRYSMFHSRYDRTTQLEVPMLQIMTGRAFILPSSARPPTCGGAVTTNCLRAADVARWNRLYGALLGIWDNTVAFTRRDASGNLAGFGPVTADMRWNHFDIGVRDTWRVNPSFTFTYGLTLKIETPLEEKDGKQAFIVDASTGQPIDPTEEIAQKIAAANQGNVFNTRFAFVPRESLDRGIYPTLFDPSPTVALAWSPSFKDGILGSLFGDRKTVLRGGYTLLWDNLISAIPLSGALNGNQLIGDTLTLNAPTCDRNGTPGPNCVAGVSPFRIGVDGTPRLPTPVASLTVPLIPASATATNRTFGAAGGFGIDPNFKAGYVHAGDFTIQRELPGKLIAEAGWIGKYGRDLSGTLNLSTPPVFIRDLTHLSQQTFAEAFDGVAIQMRRGTAASAVTPQPWFENLYGAGGTRALAAANPTSFLTGALTSLFQQNSGSVRGIDAQLLSLGMQPISTQQHSSYLWYTNHVWTNYDAFFVTLRSRDWRGLSSNFNYTLAHCRDLGSTNESNAHQPNNSYNPEFSYGDCWNDARHTLNLYGTYAIPSPRRLRGVFGGWQTSYILSWRSGNPLGILSSGDEWGQASGSLSTDTLPLDAGVNTATGVNHGITGSGGIGTNSNPAVGGTGLNLFSDPAGVYNSLHPLLISQNTRSSRGQFRGLGYFGFDMSLAKRINFGERLRARVSVDAFNILNYVNFVTPFFSLQDPANFGVIANQVTPDGVVTGDTNVGPRRLQLGIRIEF